MRFRPQQGLTIMNWEDSKPTSIEEVLKFPSPTGVNYYELWNTKKQLKKHMKLGFRPQQGLTIMNSSR